MSNLIDKEYNEINIGDIVKAENKETNETFYYFYGKNKLYNYNEQGETEEDSFKNIIVDSGLSLVNNDLWTWTRLGKEEEVYNKIFG